MKSTHRASPHPEKHVENVFSHASRSLAQTFRASCHRLVRAAVLILCAAGTGTLVNGTLSPVANNMPVIHAVSASFGISPAWSATKQKAKAQTAKKTTGKSQTRTRQVAKAATKPKIARKAKKAKEKPRSATSGGAKGKLWTAKNATKSKLRVAKPIDSVKKHRVARNSLRSELSEDTRQISASTRNRSLLNNHIYVEEEALASLHRDIESQKSGIGESLSMGQNENSSSSLYLRKQTAAGVVGGNVQDSLIAAGVPTGVINQMHSAFDGTNDLVAQMHRGDTFRVIYEAEYSQNRIMGYGKLLSMEVINSGKKTRLFWYPVDDEHGYFFDENGNTAQAPFIRVPLDVKEVSSEFQPMRRHPVTGKVRPHQGTDFRAPRGTTVRAAADGRVVFAGWGRGYGNMIRIDHGNGYETVYAHLLRIDRSVRVGSFAGRGKPIGAVGKTGMATGYHLHYELKHNGVQINPMTAKVSTSPTLTAQQRRDLKLRIAALQQTLDHMRTPKQVAQHAAANN